MIEKLQISRFKSIKELSLDCKRINVLIGEPNVGKSNILEALGLLSYSYYGRFGSHAKQFIRYEQTGNLFYDGDVRDPVHISWDKQDLEVSCKDMRFQSLLRVNGTPKGGPFTGDQADLAFHGPRDEFELFKLYRFSSRATYERQESDFLLPPSGDNLLSVLYRDKEIRSVVNLPFKERGLHLGIRPLERKLEVVKSIEDIIISYPYTLTSDTLLRLTFHLVAILSNKESVLVFEEPESHSFPYYTNYLAELIALDKNKNQYFISTHNPYFLMPLIAKAPKEEIGINIVYYKDYETRVKTLSEEEKSRAVETDIFSNLDWFLDKE